VGLGDITGVFSRYFVVGFFLPAYLSLIALWLSATSAFIPEAVESHSQATQLLILGAVGLVAGLALSGSRYLVVRTFEGYPLMQLRWPPLRLISDGAIALQRVRQKRLDDLSNDDTKTAGERDTAAWQLERQFPHDSSALLPTRLGNAIKAFELHPNRRWGLDGVTIWPRIAILLSDGERETLVDAEIDLYVFLNASLGALAVGVSLIVDKAMNASELTWHWGLYAIPFVVSYVLYRAAITPAINWGDAVRATFDMHRLEVYEKLGIREPTSFSDERAIAADVNELLLYGEPFLSDELWRSRERDGDSVDAAAPTGLISCVRRCLKGGS
jgi:hypothetical protein